jgi:thymidylate kinase
MYDVIIMDRWSLSTVVYGAAEGVSEEFTTRLAKWLRVADYTFVLHGESYFHEAEDSYEADRDLQLKVRLGYSMWALNNQKVCTMINCRHDKMHISRKMQDVLHLKGILPPR